MLDFPCHTGKPAKASTSYSTSEDLARDESPDSIVGQDYVRSSASDIVHSVNAIDLDRAPSPSTKKGRTRISPPPLQSFTDALLDAPIEPAVVDHDIAGQHRKRRSPPVEVPAAHMNSNTRPPVLLKPSVDQVSAISGLAQPTMDGSIGGIRQSDRQFEVSFGENAIQPQTDRKLDPTKPYSILQPRPCMDDAQLPLQARSPSYKTSRASAITSRVEMSLALADVVNPIESEAESTILQAIEDRERRLRQSMPEMILPNLPLEAVTNFQEYSHELREHKEHQ